MATATTAISSHSTGGTGQLLTIYWKECKYQFLQNLRMPKYSASVVLFPVMFYVLFGIATNRQQSITGVGVSAYLLATYGTFGIMGASLFGTAAGLAASRGLGWLQVKRASPMPPFAYFVAKVAVAVAFSATVVALLLALGFSFAGVHLSFVTTIKLAATLIAGSLPFCAMGLALGYFIGPNSAPAVINLIYLPLSFASGLWVPFVYLPKFVQHIAQFLPPYHLAQLALDIIGAGQKQSTWMHWEVLIGFTLICLGVARFGFQRDEEKVYS
jgi:ABC-2 type transport system permease protein